ncbi:MAG: hypothetical protein U0T83_07555 [Bacteriovoracaceae bacterium]
MEKYWGRLRIVAGGGSYTYTGWVVYNTSSSVKVTTLIEGSANNHFTVDVNSNLNYPKNFANGDKVYLRFVVPITNFSN